MAGFLRIFSQCVERMVSGSSRGSPSLSGAFTSRPLNGPPLASPTVKAAEANFAVVIAHGADVARHRPAALAHMVAYFRAVQAVNDLLHTHGMRQPAAQLTGVHRAAELVGLRLPGVQESQ